MHEEKLVSRFYRIWSAVCLDYCWISYRPLFPLSLSPATLPDLLISIPLSTLFYLLNSPPIHSTLPSSLSLYLLSLIFISPPFTRSPGPFNPVTSGLRLLQHIMTHPSPRSLPPFLTHSLPPSLDSSLPLSLSSSFSSAALPNPFLLSTRYFITQAPHYWGHIDWFGLHFMTLLCT